VVVGSNVSTREVSPVDESGQIPGHVEALPAFMPGLFVVPFMRQAGCAPKNEYEASIGRAGFAETAACHMGLSVCVCNQLTLFVTARLHAGVACGGK
jgi:hypothetical protein